MTLERLSPQSLARVQPGIAVPTYDRRSITTGIVHFGPGAFHRAHQAFFVDKLLATDSRWGICDVALRGTATPEALTVQGGLYTIAELSPSPSFRIVGSIHEAVAAPTYPEVLRARLAAASTRIVTMTVTENGYALMPSGDLDTARSEIAADLATPSAPTSLIGWLVEGLRLRRASNLAPYTMISCDNLSDNGARLRRAVVQFASQVEPDLARWIDGEARFPGTMVDSITPASDEALKARVAQATGLLDMVPVQREPFVQWVMEDHDSDPDWAAAGVTLTRDVAGYEQAKLRILNGAHSTLAYLGLLRGRRTTRDAMADPMLAAFARTLVGQDIAPSLTPPAGLDLAAYAENVFERIANPAIEHHLGQIAFDGTLKLAIRLYPVIEAAIAAQRPLDRLAIPVAAWMRFIRRRAREGTEIIDPQAERLAERGTASTGTGAHDVMLFAEFLPRTDPAITAALARAYDAIGDGGLLPGDGW
ncbi:MAG: mannitol dehydrogenase family protein [Proteobacteria bacterium]|nr:mannitol dehydrogenase family protein [Pseudomonadota bacterium]